jgi:hypothetical protein
MKGKKEVERKNIGEDGSRRKKKGKRKVKERMKRKKEVERKYEGE